MASSPMPGCPDFFIVGAAKAGTTSLWNYLRGHDGVHLGPIKEPNFFAYGPEGPNVTGPAPAEELRERLHGDTVTDPDRYRELFAGATEGQVTGEASVRYLYKPGAAARIAAGNPEAKLVIMLRDPLERLRSHYTMNRSWGLEPLALDAAVAAEDERVDRGWGWDWHYVRVGLYADQVARYLDHFDRQQLLFVPYHRFRAEPVAVVQEVARHLGIDDGYVPDTTVKAKQAYLPRSALVDALRGPNSPLRAVGSVLPAGIRHRAGAALRRANNQQTEELSDHLVGELAGRFDADRDALEALIGPDALWPGGRTN